MKITYLGHSSFLIEGKEKSVVTDPFADIGYNVERVSADYCTVSHSHFDHSNTDGVNAKKVITGTSDGFLAINSFHDPNLGGLRGENVIFKFTVDGVRFCHMGDIGEYLSDSLTEQIGEVDVLMIPVGGTYTIDGKEAVRYANAIKAKITIPMHYKTSKSNIDITDASKFLRGMAGVTRVEKSIELDGWLSEEDPSVLVFDDSEF